MRTRCCVLFTTRAALLLWSNTGLLTATLSFPCLVPDTTAAQIHNCDCHTHTIFGTRSAIRAILGSSKNGSTLLRKFPNIECTNLETITTSVTLCGIIGKIGPTRVRNCRHSCHFLHHPISATRILNPTIMTIPTYIV